MVIPVPIPSPQEPVPPAGGTPTPPQAPPPALTAVQDSATLAREAEAAGADVVEIGVPFSDSMADGATIQRASFASLQGGFTLTWFFLGIGFFPAVWCISFYFIRRSMALEAEEVAEVQSGGANQP